MCVHVRIQKHTDRQADRQAHNKHRNALIKPKPIGYAAAANMSKAASLQSIGEMG